MMPNSAGLNGTRYTCKAETASGEIYSKTVDILVKGIPHHLIHDLKEYCCAFSRSYMIGR